MPPADSSAAHQLKGRFSVQEASIIWDLTYIRWHGRNRSCILVFGLRHQYISGWLSWKGNLLLQMVYISWACILIQNVFCIISKQRRFHIWFSLIVDCNLMASSCSGNWERLKRKLVCQMAWLLCLEQYTQYRAEETCRFQYKLLPAARIIKETVIFCVYQCPEKG